MFAMWCMYRSCPNFAAADEDNQTHPTLTLHSGAMATDTSS